MTTPSRSRPRRIRWTHDDLATFATDPKKLVAGTKMALAGLKRSQDVEDLVACLSQLDEEGNVKALQSALGPGLGAEGMVGSQ